MSIEQKPLFPSILLIIVSALLFCGLFLHFVQVLRDKRLAPRALLRLNPPPGLPRLCGCARRPWWVRL